jgi:hypothetical protein
MKPPTDGDAPLDCAKSALRTMPNCIVTAEPSQAFDPRLLSPARDRDPDPDPNRLEQEQEQELERELEQEGERFRPGLATNGPLALKERRRTFDRD